MTDVDVKAADIELKVEEGMDCDDSEVDMDVHEESALDECRRFCAGLMAGVVTKQEEFEKQLKEELRKEAECIGEKVQGVLNEVKEVRQEIERFKTESAAMFSTLNLRVNQCGVSEIKNELERFKTESATELSKLNLRVDQCDVSEIKNELEGLKNDSSNIIDSMDKKISACAEKFITAGLSSLNPKWPCLLLW